MALIPIYDMSDLIKLIIIGLVVLILAIITTIWLFNHQKSNRYFDRKGVFYFGLVAFLLFGIFGFVGMVSPYKFSNLYLMNQSIVMVLGIINLWLLFSIFRWPSHESFLPELLFTLLIAFIGILGFMTVFALSDHYFGVQAQHLITQLSIMLCFPIPYLLFKTYDFILQIPSRTYFAWRFPDKSPPLLDLSDSNVIYIHLHLHADCPESPANEIVQRTRYPRNTKFSHFFQNFVSDYNLGSNNRQTIACLYKDGLDNPIGWMFYLKKNRRSRGVLLDPEERGLGPIREGDYILAKRVILDKDRLEEMKSDDDFIDLGNDTPDDIGDIVISEK